MKRIFLVSLKVSPSPSVRVHYLWIFFVEQPLCKRWMQRERKCCKWFQLCQQPRWPGGGKIKRSIWIYLIPWAISNISLDGFFFWKGKWNVLVAKKGMLNIPNTFFSGGVKRESDRVGVGGLNGKSGRRSAKHLHSIRNLICSSLNSLDWILHWHRVSQMMSDWEFLLNSWLQGPIREFFLWLSVRKGKFAFFKKKFSEIAFKLKNF